jgi:hypothetical protein
MPGRVDGETAFEATGLLAFILEFSFATYVQNGGKQGVQLGEGLGLQAPGERLNAEG